MTWIRHKHWLYNYCGSYNWFLTQKNTDNWFFIEFSQWKHDKTPPKIAKIFNIALVAQNNKKTRLICAFVVLRIYNFVQRWKNCSEITAWSPINLGVWILFFSNGLGKIDEIGRGYKKSCQSNEGKENKVFKPEIISLVTVQGWLCIQHNQIWTFWQNRNCKQILLQKSQKETFHLCTYKESRMKMWMLLNILA